MAEAGVDLRPRSTGEILDDAWRLALADAPLLMLFAALFLVPAFCVVLLLLARPAAGAGQLLLPALAALLLPLTGIGSGACQELFRRRLEDQPAGAMDCLRAALRHGLEHAAARAVVLVAVFVGLILMGATFRYANAALVILLAVVGEAVLLVLPGLMAWAAATPVHALIAAGRGRTGGLWRELTREAAFNPAKAAAVTLTRLPLLFLAALNLHLLFQVLLWVADNLAGFDVVLLAVELAPFANPVYGLALLLLSWLLLAPFFEASNFLLHLDARTRQEGLDLFYRVQRVFPTSERQGDKETGRQGEDGGTGWLSFSPCLLVSLSFLLAAAGRVQAQEPPRPTPQQVKSLLRREGPAGRPEKKGEETKAEKKDREKRDVERDEPQPQGRRGSGPAGPSVSAGFGAVGWLVLAGLAVAVLVVACLLFIQSRRGPATEMKSKPKPAREQEPANLPLPENRSGEQLWREAESLAGAGQYREAVRLMYLAVLFVLDRRRLLRYEPTRTNGEYVRQVRLAEEAPPDLHAPFESLTALFERKWYGDRSCEAGEYDTCKALAEEVRQRAAA
jgi:hypothetical protein